MLFVDDFAIIGIIKRRFPILPDDFFFYFSEQSIFDLLIAIYIIRCHTGLPAV